MKKQLLISAICLCSASLWAQETLQSVTDRGSSTNNFFKITGVNNIAGGSGLELFYDPASSTGVINSYDRTGAIYKKLVFASSYNSFEAGNIGIGYSADQGYKLAVNGDGKFRNNLGLGGATPAYALSVNATENIYSGQFYQPSSASTSYNVIRWLGAMTSAVGYIGVGGPSTPNGAFQNSFVIGTQSGHRLAFSAGDAYAGGIFPATQNWGIGYTTDQGYKLAVSGDGKFSNNLGLGGATPTYALSVNATEDIYSGQFYQPSSASTSYNVTRWLGAMTSAVGYIGVGGPSTPNGAFQNSFVIGTQSGHRLAFSAGDAYAGGIFPTTQNWSIGYTTDQGYKLAVNGNIRAQEIKVEAANWPDYVFQKDYQLPSLAETEKHIQEKGHLPGIPSAAEVKTKGVDLGEMNAKLVQKIEELTLHLIEKDKEINQLKKMEQRIRELEDKMDRNAPNQPSKK